MAERGASTEARILLRALSETLFLALGMFSKPDMLALLQEDNAAHRKGIANAIIQMNIVGKVHCSHSRPAKSWVHWVHWVHADPCAVIELTLPAPRRTALYRFEASR